MIMVRSDLLRWHDTPPVPTVRPSDRRSRKSLFPGRAERRRRQAPVPVRATKGR